MGEKSARRRRRRLPTVAPAFRFRHANDALAFHCLSVDNNSRFPLRSRARKLDFVPILEEGNGVIELLIC